MPCGPRARLTVIPFALAGPIEANEDAGALAAGVDVDDATDVGGDVAGGTVAGLDDELQPAASRPHTAPRPTTTFITRMAGSMARGGVGIQRCTPVKSTATRSSAPTTPEATRSSRPASPDEPVASTLKPESLPSTLASLRWSSDTTTAWPPVESMPPTTS